MIVRILGEGQRELAAEHLPELNVLDDALSSAAEAGDEAAFTASLTQLLDRVRELATPLPDDDLVVSDVVLPGPGSTLPEVLALLGEEGLVPG